MASTRFSQGSIVGEVLRDVAEHVEEEPIRELHDVRLRHAGNALAVVLARVLECEADDPLRAFAADRLHRDAGAGRDLFRLQGVELRDHALCLRSPRLVLDPGVEVFRVLADDHEVDVVVAGADALERLARTQAGKEAELVAERDVDRAETSADRRRDRPLQRDLVRLHRGEGLIRQWCAFLLHDVNARLPDIPVEGDPSGLQNAAGCLGQLRTGPVAGDEGDTVRHARASLHTAWPTADRLTLCTVRLR